MKWGGKGLYNIFLISCARPINGDPITFYGSELAVANLHVMRVRSGTLWTNVFVDRSSWTVVPVSGVADRGREEVAMSQQLSLNSQAWGGCTSHGG